MSLAPGFLEWQQAEDRRILLEAVKKHEANVEAKLIQKEKEDAANDINSKYYDRLAYNAYFAWSEVKFIPGKEQDAYLAANAVLVAHIQKLKDKETSPISGTSPHTLSE